MLHVCFQSLLFLHFPFFISCNNDLKMKWRIFPDFAPWKMYAFSVHLHWGCLVYKRKFVISLACHLDISKSCDSNVSEWLWHLMNTNLETTNTEKKTNYRQWVKKADRIKDSNTRMSYSFSSIYLFAIFFISEAKCLFIDAGYISDSELF